MKVIIAGGTGFIGQHLVNHLTKNGNEVIVLGRSCKPDDKNAAVWDGKTLSNWVEKLRGTEVLINLTGKSVDCRYTEKNKQEIIDSRVNSISVLEKAFKQIKEQTNG
jgi:NAD dependent epimerase/dehydratase family enzyme